MGRLLRPVVIPRRPLGAGPLEAATAASTQGLLRHLGDGHRPGDVRETGLVESHHGYAESLRTLLRVVGTAQSVRVVLIAPQGEVIESVYDIM